MSQSEQNKHVAGTVRTATVIGATGLIGSRLVELLQQDPGFSAIRLVVRRSFNTDHPGTEVRKIDFDDETAFRASVEGSDAIFCAVGTTTRKVKGDRTAYRKVDVDIPVNAARFALESGCPQFLLVSSIGASSRSRTFYLQLKGEVEDTLKEMAIPSISVFRPSLLLGKRKEKRFGERMAGLVMGPLSFAVPSRYKPIRARNVAAAMLAASHENRKGFSIYHYEEMMELIRSHHQKP